MIILGPVSLGPGLFGNAAALDRLVGGTGICTARGGD